MLKENFSKTIPQFQSNGFRIWQEAKQKAEYSLNLTKQISAHCISKWNPHYPQVLNYVLNENGTRYFPIPIIFYKGNLSLLNQPCIAIFGNDNCDSTAIKASTNIAKNLCDRGVYAVSSLDSGCNSAAHTSVAINHGQSIAVLSCGFNRIKDSRQQSLAETILDNGGLLLSIYAPDDSSASYKVKNSFVIMAGMTQASVIISASADDACFINGAMAAANAHKSIYALQYDLPYINTICNRITQHIHTDTNGVINIPNGDTKQIKNVSKIDLDRSTNTITTSLRPKNNSFTYNQEPLSILQILTLLNIPQFSPVTLFDIASYFTAILQDSELLQVLTEKFASEISALQGHSLETWRYATQKAQKQLAVTSQIGATCLSYWNSDFPPALRQTMDKNGIKQIPIPIIFYKGNLNLLNTPCLAMSGYSQCSTRQLTISSYIAKELSLRGICIVSGLTKINNIYTHRGALKGPGNTIAILDSGINNITPYRFKNLANDIVAQGGLLLSQYEPDCANNLQQQRAANLLITSIAKSLIVIACEEDDDVVQLAIAAQNAGKQIYAFHYGYPDLDNKSLSNQQLHTKYNTQWINTRSNYQLSSELDSVARQIQHPLNITWNYNNNIFPSLNHNPYL